jgi:pimeloyl-ACP methyl ester carboxylesterase
MRGGVLLAMVLGLVSGSRAEDGPKKGLEGNWEGTLKAGPVELRLAFHVMKEKGSFKATFDSIDQGARGLPVEEAKQDGKKVTFTMKTLAASYEGKLDDAEAAIDGTFKQAGAEFPLMLKRVDKVSELRRPQTPKPPFPYREEAVKVENKDGKATLAGTLTLPPGKGPFPAAILISGSGPQDRDETIFEHRPFLVLADALTRRGVALLRVDDRGVGQSTGGGVLDSTSEDMASDVRAELVFLRSRAEIDPKRIGLIGHSEGGIIAPMVAAKDRQVAFIVLLAGTGLPGEEIMYQQAEDELKAQKADEKTLRLERETQRKIFALMKSEKDPRVLEEKIRPILDATLAEIPELARDPKAAKGFVDAQVAMIRSPWLRFFLTYDPRPALSQVKCPVLALVGAKDVQVAAAANLAAVETAVKSGGNERVTAKALSGLNHLFQTCTTGSITEYARIEETIAPSALKEVVDWVAAQVDPQRNGRRANGSR